MVAASYRYCGSIWQSVYWPFWAHSYYEGFATTKGAIAERTEDQSPILIVVKSANTPSVSLREFRETRDLNGLTVTPEQLAQVKPIGSKLPDSEPRMIISEEYWLPDFIRLREHPVNTEVLYKKFPVGADVAPGLLQYLAYALIAAPPIAGFALCSAIVLSVGWVIDGFRGPAAPATEVITNENPTDLQRRQEPGQGRGAILRSRGRIRHVSGRR